MSKTPYEIRLELLKLSNEILSASAIRTSEVLMTEYHSRLTDDDRHEEKFPTMPAMPTVEEVISKAHELNNFVSNQN